MIPEDVYFAYCQEFIKKMNKLLGYCGKFYLELLWNYSALFLKKGGGVTEFDERNEFWIESNSY